MNRIVLILTAFLLSCTNSAVDKHETQDDHEDHATTEAREPSALQLNNGAKWNADEATKKNVAVLSQVLENTSNDGFDSRDRLTTDLQSALDTLVQQCKMKGADHDALHIWLETVMQDVKDLKKVDEHGYPEVRTRLKKDVESFHEYFA